MTTYTAAVNSTNEALSILKQLGTDEQLALLWFVYNQMGHFITPAAPGTASPDIASETIQPSQSDEPRTATSHHASHRRKRTK